MAAAYPPRRRLATEDTESTEEDREKTKSGWVTGNIAPPIAHPVFLSRLPLCGLCDLCG
jgi:hypothetical protein